MKSGFTEFAYGFALTHQLISLPGLPLYAAPVFPSLVEEGRKGGGYDLALKLLWLPIFLQFKLSDILVRKSAAEAKQGLLNTPYYRINLRNTLDSKQHNMLVDLECSTSPHPIVRYAAPSFSGITDFNHHFFGNSIIQHSIFISPSRIGWFLDNKDHSVSFEDPTNFVLRSTPVIMNENISYGNFIDNIAAAFEVGARSSPESADQLLESLLQIVFAREDRLETMDEFRGFLSNFGSIMSQISYLAQAEFNCQLYLISPDSLGGLQQ